MAIVQTVGLVGLAAVGVLAATSLFTVDQTQQVLVTRFGAPQRVITEPGLKFKLSVVENVIVLDRRILDLESPAQEVISQDQKRLVVDAFARYRIADPLRYFQATAGNLNAGNLRLKSILDSSVRRVLGENIFTTVVRDRREELMHVIRDQVNREAQGLGMSVVDVRIRRADLPEQNSEAVFRRMQTERQREAAEIRAQGTEISDRIRAQADRAVVGIRAEAERIARETLGAGDAERTRLLAEAYGRDPEFFSFYRSMQAYEQGLKAGYTRFVLTPESDFFRYLNDPNGRQRPREAPKQ